MAFDPKKDYTAAIAKEKDPAKQQQLQAEKQEKIASMSSSGLDYTKAQDVQKYNQQYAGDNQRYEFNMNAAPMGGGVIGGGGFAPPSAVDNSAEIRAMYEQMKAAELASVKQAGDKAVSDYTAQIQGAPAQFQPEREKVDVSTVRNIQRANEVAAAKGTTFSGGVQSDQGGMASTGEAQKTALTQSEMNLVNSLKKAIADTNAATSMKQVELTAQNQAGMSQALLAEKNRIAEANYRAAQDKFNADLSVAGLTGTYGGTRTLAGQQMDTANKQYQEQFGYQKERDIVGDTQWNKQFTQTQQNWNKTFDYQKDRDKVQDGQWMKQFEQSKADAAASRAISWGNLQLNREQFAWSKDPKNPNNVMKAQENESQQFQSMFKQALDMMEMTKKTVDPNTGQVVEIPMYSASQIGNLIDNSKLSDAEAYRLRKSLSIPDPVYGPTK